MNLVMELWDILLWLSVVSAIAVIFYPHKDD